MESLSPPTEGLHGRSAVGQRLRTVRHRRRATLAEIAGEAGVSESFLSQVERGRSGVSLDVVVRIAAALHIHVADVFEPDPASTPRVLRREDRPCMTEWRGFRAYLLTASPLKHLELFFFELEPGASTADEPLAHGESEEAVLVLAGAIQLTVGPTEYALNAGDSIAYNSATPHIMTNRGRDVAEAVIALSSPTR